MQKSLTKTLVFQLQPDESGQQLLDDAFLEARSVYNETIQRAKNGEDWDEIRQDLESNANLVNNTAQLVVQKSLEAIENYYEYDDYNQPSYTKDGAYPLRSNYEEGYNLFPEDDCIRYRISAKPYNPVKGTLYGSPAALEQLRNAIESDDWRVGTAEAMNRNGNYELHINTTHTEAEVRDKEDSRTVVGVDINEDCVALAVLHEDDIVDSVVIDFPEIKEKRHRYFTIRKRMQYNGKSSFDRAFEQQEERFVHGQLHKVSRQVVEWVSRFEKPCIVFEDLKEMRDSIDYGTRMNRRLHSLPFRKLREFITYKAAFQGIPSDEITPEYTSQACSLTECEHTTRANRNKKRFKCVECRRQDHADRNAAINIAKKGLAKLNRNVPALKTLPNVRKLRRQVSGCVNQPTVTHDTARGHHADGVAGVSD
ncbi:RNA-guided endonuclease InsQ/TnpB family protein [Natronorubrum sulfidifaciens]|uniref:IS1341-type transposase n=1 Tax=Natronorubrum sulfidifaciens JCM 14089 TaxID=1230460 RepID=L9W5N8_9EURY|nr:RNA-guided endonuclease TnpB family protein [Natronorubrum sulfidifaciens]ELY44581.1 IS1341-type transposase [Natronorubrum sulfidifaciens JCM 14089]